MMDGPSSARAGGGLNLRSLSTFAWQNQVYELKEKQIERPPGSALQGATTGFFNFAELP